MNLNSNNDNCYHTIKSQQIELYICISKLWYERHLEKIQSSLTNNPKYFWKFVKNKQKSNTIPHNITYGDTASTSLDETVNMFKLYFESVYTKCTELTNPVYGFESDINISTCEFTVAEIFETLRSLFNDYKNGPGLNSRNNLS